MVIAIDKILKQTQTKLVKEIFKQIKKALVSEVVVNRFQQVALNRFRAIQVGYFGSNVGEDDPTAPMYYENEIRQEVKTQLALSAASVNIQTGNIALTVLSDSFLGIDTAGPQTTKDPTPMRWIYYFIFSSFNTDLLWVNQETYAAIFPSRGGGELGRFGKGYLIEINTAGRKEYFEKALSSRGLDYNSLIHPQSNKTGNPSLFLGMAQEANFNELVVNPAVRAAISELNK